jgi:hypothetical protein
MAREAWMPDWIAATADQIGALRAAAVGGSAPVFGVRPTTVADSHMSPLEAVVVATSMVQRRARDHGMQWDRAVSRMIESALADENSTVAAQAHRWLDRLGIRR